MSFSLLLLKLTNTLNEKISKYHISFGDGSEDCSEDDIAKVEATAF